jgi:hypothetical protein
MKTRLRVTTALFAASGMLLVGLTAASASNSGKAPDLSKLAPAMAAKAASASLVGNPPAATESVFVPITPCRIADTRIAGGAIGNGLTKAFYVRGTTGFNTQGGKVGGCGVPSSATGVTANVTIPSVSSGGGYMIGWPYGATRPNTNFVTYPTSQTVTVNPTFALTPGGSDPSLAIYNHGHSAYVVMDVTGYYAPQLSGMVTSSGGIYNNSGRILSTAHVGTGIYKVTWDSDVTYCTPVVTAYSGANVYASAYNFSGTSTYIYTWYLDGSHAPTAFDTYVYVAVHC